MGFIRQEFFSFDNKVIWLLFFSVEIDKNVKILRSYLFSMQSKAIWASFQKFRRNKILAC